MWLLWEDNGCDSSGWGEFGGDCKGGLSRFWGAGSHWCGDECRRWWLHNRGSAIMTGGVGACAVDRGAS